MPGNVIIAGFSAADKVPGAYGQVQYGTSGQSSAGLPLLCLLVGLKLASGTLIADTQVAQIYQQSDADTFAGAGSELACMAYDALKTAPNVPTFIASPALPGGAVAANAAYSITGAWSTAGSFVLRVNGFSITTQVGSADTATTVAANLAANINGALAGRVQISASASVGIVTISDKTPSIRGNQMILFTDNTNAPSGFVGTITGLAWATSTAYPLNSYVVPTVANGFYYKATAISGTGTSSPTTQPTWPTTIGTPFTDNPGANQIIWTCWGQIVASGATTGVTLGGGTGLETYTNILATIFSKQYDRIAIASNDATSAALWKTQTDAQATINNGLLQHAGLAMNATIALAQSLAQTTLNDQRFQVLFYANSETVPSRMTAANMANRANAEVNDPDASYDGTVYSTIAPQTQPADLASHAQQVTMLNNSVTPLITVNGQAVISRAITTHSLLNANPDYSTLDTGMAVVPDFVLTFMKFYFTTIFQPANLRVRGDLAPGEHTPAAGVAYPQLWTAAVQGRLLEMQGQGGSQPTIPGTCPPILYNADIFPPTTSYDPNAKRLMCAVPCWPMPTDHQLGLSIQQAS